MTRIRDRLPHHPLAREVRSIGRAARDQGIDVIDAVFSGGTEQFELRRLALFVGGTDAALAKALPV